VLDQLGQKVECVYDLKSSWCAITQIENGRIGKKVDNLICTVDGILIFERIALRQTRQN